MSTIAKTDLDALMKFKPDSGGANEWFKVALPPGQDTHKYKIRICPPPPGEPLPVFRASIHYFRNIPDDEGNNRLVSGACPREFDNYCPACDWYFACRQIGMDDKEIKAVLRDLNAQTRFYFNVIDRGEEDAARVKVWGTSYNVATDIISNLQAYAEEGIDITDPDKGYDFMVTIKKRGASFNYGSVARMPRSSKIGVDGWEDQLHDLKAKAHQRILTAEEIKPLIPQVLGPFHAVLEDTYKANRRGPKGQQPAAAKSASASDNGKLSKAELEELTVPDLKALCKKADLPVSGNKAALVKRLGRPGGTPV